MSDQMDGSWSRRKRHAAGGTLTAPACHATILTALSRPGHSPGPALMPPPAQAIPFSLGYLASAERSIGTTCDQATAGQPRTASATRHRRTSRIRTTRIPGPGGPAVWQVSS